MIKKVSDINYLNIADYLRLDTKNIDELEMDNLKTYLNIAKTYISNYTGIPIEKTNGYSEKTLDDYSDFIIVVYVLCQDMYDNRSMYVEKNNMNKVVETILDMHQRNLI